MAVLRWLRYWSYSPPRRQPGVVEHESTADTHLALSLRKLHLHEPSVTLASLALGWRPSEVERQEVGRRSAHVWRAKRGYGLGALPFPMWICARSAVEW